MELGEVEIVRHGVGGRQPGADEARVCLIGGGADDNGPHAEHAGLGQGFENSAGPGIRPAQAGSDQRRHQASTLLVAGFFHAVPGDSLLEFRAVGANVFLRTAALRHCGPEIPVLAAPDGPLYETAGRVKVLRHLSELRPFRQFGAHRLYRQGQQLGQRLSLADCCLL
nr:hypothetical protein [uncultured Rhodopila sp.]